MELDAYSSDNTEKHTDVSGAGTVCFSREALDKTLSETVIIVPCKNEDVEVIRNVVSAIPASCLVILVSNCGRDGGDDGYLRQIEMLQAFGGYNRQILAIHQKDATAAAAFKASGMPDLLDPSGETIRNGKGEGMLLGIALAAAFSPGRRYVGFIDADNYHGGSVNEYCRAFAAGFAMSPSAEPGDCMVRLRWSSKPKLRNGRLEFVPEGRCSRIVNSWLNRLLAAVPSKQRRRSTRSGPAPDDGDGALVTTGNAGEHAMTMGLALKLRMAAGYAIEPFHFVDMLERGGHSTARKSNGIIRETTTKPLQKPVRVLQVRTLSPHLHRPSDTEHIRQMWSSGLGAIYHNIGPNDTGSGSGSEDGAVARFLRDMRSFAAKHGGLDRGTGELPRPRIYPALENLDVGKFREVMMEEKMPVGLGSLRPLRVFGFGLGKRERR